MKTLFQSNHLFYIESLKADELDKPDDHLFFSCIKPLTDNVIISSSFHSVNSVADLNDLLTQIFYETRDNMCYPIIHIDAHGDSEFGLKLSNDAIYPWEILVNSLRRINVECKNNLFITFSTCFSHKIFSKISLQLACPFYSIILTNKEIKVSELKIRYHSFYNQFLLSGDLDKALNLLNLEYPEIENSLFYFNSEILFDKTFDSFIIKMKNERKFENLFYSTINGYYQSNEIRKNRRFNRRFLKEEKKIFPNKIKRIKYHFKKIFCMKRNS